MNGEHTPWEPKYSLHPSKTLLFESRRVRIVLHRFSDPFDLAFYFPSLILSSCRFLPSDSVIIYLTVLFIPFLVRRSIIVYYVKSKG